MTAAEVTFPVAMAIAGVMAVIVLYLAVRGAPGVVSLSPPEGSPRWPVYGFFGPWFVAGFADSAAGGADRTWLVVRMIMFLVVLVAFIISWRRLKASPTSSLPPRV